MAFGNVIRRPSPARAGWRDFDRLMDDLWSGFGLAPVAFAPAGPDAERGAFSPRFEAVELENEYRVTAEMPGVDPADVEVTVDGGVLSVKGHRVVEEEGEAEQGGVQRVSERGRFERRIRFPGDIVESEVKATHRHGVLTVSLPKPRETKPEVRAIPVETA